MARHFFDDLNVVGRRYSPGDTYNAAADYEIVGVVTNAKYTQVRGEFPSTAYVPFTGGRSALHGLYFHVRAPGDPIVLGASVRSVVQGIDPSLAIVEMDSMTNQIGESLWQEHLFARLTTAFSAPRAGAGVRRALRDDFLRRRPAPQRDRGAHGARARYAQVLWMILRQALALAVAGVAVGIPLSMWASVCFDFPFGLTPRDPVTLG